MRNKAFNNLSFSDENMDSLATGIMKITTDFHHLCLFSAKLTKCNSWLIVLRRLVKRDRKLLVRCLLPLTTSVCLFSLSFHTWNRR